MIANYSAEIKIAIFESISIECQRDEWRWLLIALKLTYCQTCEQIHQQTNKQTNKQEEIPGWKHRRRSAIDMPRCMEKMSKFLLSIDTGWWSRQRWREGVIRRSQWDCVNDCRQWTWRRWYPDQVHCRRRSRDSDCLSQPPVHRSWTFLPNTSYRTNSNSNYNNLAVSHRYSRAIRDVTCMPLSRGHVPALTAAN